MFLDIFVVLFVEFRFICVCYRKNQNKIFVCFTCLYVYSDYGLYFSGIMLFVQYQNEIENISIDGEDIHDISILSIFHHLTKLKGLEVSFSNNLTNRSLLGMLENQFRRYLTCFFAICRIFHMITPKMRQNFVSRLIVLYLILN